MSQLQGSHFDFAFTQEFTEEDSFQPWSFEKLTQELDTNYILTWYEGFLCGETPIKLYAIHQNYIIIILWVYPQLNLMLYLQITITFYL